MFLADIWRAFPFIVDCGTRGELFEENNGSKRLVSRKPRALMFGQTCPTESKVMRSEHENSAAHCLRTGTYPTS
jgi:hypothetical protein